MNKAPVTVNNFVSLTRSKFYNGIYVHRVVKDFVFQAGDPNATTPDSVVSAGAGDAGYEFGDELPKQGEYRIGDLVMANAGPNTNGSQFFVITGRSGQQLPPNYSLFGSLASEPESLATLNAINALADKGDGPPTSPVYIVSGTIFEALP